MLRAALQDKAAPVRRMAVDALATDDEGIALLRQALTDRDQGVRELAAMKLEPVSDDPAGP